MKRVRMPQITRVVAPLNHAQLRRLADTAALFQALGGGWWNRSDVTPDVGNAAGPSGKLRVAQ
jgi:hypothetical protein